MGGSQGDDDNAEDPAGVQGDAGEPPDTTGWSGPASEARRLIRQASPTRLAARIVLVLLACIAIGAGARLAWDSCQERRPLNGPAGTETVVR